jgi:hypothetical protein
MARECFVTVSSGQAGIEADIVTRWACEISRSSDSVMKLSQGVANWKE